MTQVKIPKYIIDLGSISNIDLNNLYDKNYVGYWASLNKDNVLNKPENTAGTFFFFNTKSGTNRSLQFCTSTGNGNLFYRFFFNDPVCDWQKVPFIKTANVSGTTDSNGNININSSVGSGKIIISFARDSNGYDGVYTPFYSPNGTCYIHVANWDGAKAASATVSGTAYYIDK